MTSEEYAQAQAQLRELYEINLERHDVRWPNGQALVGLVYLFSKMPEVVSKEELTLFVRHTHPGSGDYQDIRHLADFGWDICSTNGRFTRGRRIPPVNGVVGYRLGSAEHPNAIWAATAKIKRKGILNADSWNELLMLYEQEGCAVCGRCKPPYDRGHLDSSKPAVLGNIVPMCVDCNMHAQAHNFDFVLFGTIARPVVRRTK